MGRAPDASLADSVPYKSQAPTWMAETFTWTVGGTEGASYVGGSLLRATHLLSGRKA